MTSRLFQNCRSKNCVVRGSRIDSIVFGIDSIATRVDSIVTKNRLDCSCFFDRVKCADNRVEPWRKSSRFLSQSSRFFQSSRFLSQSSRFLSQSSRFLSQSSRFLSQSSRFWSRAQHNFWIDNFETNGFPYSAASSQPRRCINLPFTEPFFALRDVIRIPTPSP